MAVRYGKMRFCGITTWWIVSSADKNIYMKVNTYIYNHGTFINQYGSCIINNENIRYHVW